MANSAKNIEIGNIEITVHAICLALEQASSPSGLAVASGQSMAASTSDSIVTLNLYPKALMYVTFFFWPY